MALRSTRGRILVDVGFKNLFNGINDKYLEFVRRVAERASGEVLAVSPDVPGDVRATRESFERWAPKLRALRVGVVYVCQGLECPDVGADVYAMPLRRIAYRGAKVDCARDPLTCARAVAAAMLVHDIGQYHVLGPAKRALLHLIRLGMCRYIRSFNTLLYRRAVTMRLKRMMGGKWQTTSWTLPIFLEEWMRGIECV